MNLFFKNLFLAASLLAPAIAFPVTQKEMEQARTIATKAYLRYANDGSGYLDDLSPTTMEELESKLKAKEKENIKAFKEIPVPSDYKNWDKEKLVEYWAVTAFQNANLLEKGRGGRLRARSQINKMTVTPPSAQAPAAPTPAAPTAPVPEPAQASQTPEAPTLANDSPADAIAATEEVLAAQEEAMENEPQELSKESSDTWVYVMVLAILVAIVIALVVYAANVFKKNNRGGASGVNMMPDTQINEKLEQYEATITHKNAEILMLNKKLESAARQNSDLKAQLEELSGQLASIRSQARPSAKEEIKPDETSPKPRPSAVKSIFLGRANAKGIFIRADRTLNVGNSVFVLETSDGFSGTFKVADSPAAWSLALSNPREYLENACTGYDLDNTSSASKIITDTSGTAVFEGGCWRVIRKAKIRYE